MLAAVCFLSHFYRTAHALCGCTMCYTGYTPCAALAACYCSLTLCTLLFVSDSALCSLNVASCIDVRDVRPGLKQVNAEPPIYTIDNFLTDDECARLIETAGPLLQRSKTHAAAGACPAQQKTKFPHH